MDNISEKSRFNQGGLVMLSLKYDSPKTIRYMHPEGTPLGRGGYALDTFSFETVAGHMKRGVPFFLVDTPEFIAIKTHKSLRSGRPSTKEKKWKLRILFEEKIYHMYLTKKQYNHQLVKAVPRRLKKT